MDRSVVMSWCRRRSADVNEAEVLATVTLLTRKTRTIKRLTKNQVQLSLARELRLRHPMPRHELSKSSDGERGT